MTDTVTTSTGPTYTTPGDSLTVHVNPRTVASWDGQPSIHSPRQLASGRRSVGGLARSLDATVALVTKAPAKHVGHIVVANHPDDPVLTDAQWRQIAVEVMRRAGLSKGPQDPDAVRWVAVRHDDTSIHIAYTKVRESGRPAGYVNYTRAWEAMRHEWEERLGLVPTGKADGTARRPYGQAESARSKAAQHAGDTDARPDTAELRHLCRVVALEVDDGDTYFARLRSAGLTVTEERNSAGERTGYRVGLRSRADGDPVLYSGAGLDPALGVDALSSRWRLKEPPYSATKVALPEPTWPRGNAPAGDVPELEDLMRGAAWVTGDRAFFDAAETYGSAERRRRPLPLQDRSRGSASVEAHQLRAVAALLGSFARLGPATGRRSAAAELALVLAAVLAERAAWHEQVGDQASSRAAIQAHRRILSSVPIGLEPLRAGTPYEVSRTPDQSSVSTYRATPSRRGPVDS